MTTRSCFHDLVVIPRVVEEAMNALAPHLHRSPLLGATRALALPQGRLDYYERGEGPPLVFAHGWLANANVWRGVVDALADRFRCIALDLPLGSHRRALDKGADLSPDGCGRLILDALAALDVTGATLVGNDSGGAYSQIAVARDASRVSRLVLAACETPYDPFPPPPFDGLPAVARDAAALRTVLGALRDPAVRSSPNAYGKLAKHGLEAAIGDSYVLPCLADDGVLRDFAKAVSSAASAPVHAAGRALVARHCGPVRFVWPTEDPVFPIEHARRFAASLADGKLVAIADAYSFLGEDQPAALAAAIAAFAGESSATTIAPEGDPT
jgi:pimeloyl-ACP methyl ester carboxylesterase